MSEKLEPRKVCDLKVTELRSELEKRDLDKTGVKAILLERLQKALLEEGEDPENCVFDKLEFKNVITEKSLMSEKKSPSVEKKKPVTPTKTIKKNVIGRRPGPKSKTCVTQLKVEKITSSISQKENDDVNQEQVDSSNVIASSEDSKTILSDTINSDVIDSNEAEAKEIDADEAQLNEAGVINAISSHENQTVIAIDSDSTSTHENTKEFEGEIDVAQINPKNTNNFINYVKGNEIKQTKCLDNLGTDAEVTENSSKINNDIEEQKYKNNVTGVKEVIPETNEDEDDIQDEELDHEIDEELDHEVEEEEKNYRTDNFNQTNNTEKSTQEHNKDDNNEDSINLTIGEDDIKLFADEEDTNIEKEDEVTENHTKEETLIKQRESRHPVTASSSRATTGLVKSRRSATEKRSSVGDKPRSTHKEDKDISIAKPIISVSVPKDEKKEEDKQVKDKVEAGNKQSNDSKVLQISSETSKKNNSSLVRNIWVSGLASITKATDLKQLFSKYGKVVGAKVVTNAKTPGARCYGFVTLSSAEDANRSIENLHKTELHGRVISVERAKRDNGYQVTAKSSNASKVNENSETEQNTKKTEEKKEKREEKREKRPEITINDVKKPDLCTLKRSLSKDLNQESKRSKIVIERDDRKKDRSIKSKSNERDREKLRELERERERLEREKRRQQEILNLTKMKTERERLKQKEQERAIREEERKRRIEKERQLEIERKQKEEAIRLEKERQKLRIERERIEKEKSELLRLERENQRLERERLQREKEELRRAQEKLEETKRQAILKRAMPPSPPLPSKRHSSSNSSRYEERKEPIRSSRIQPSTDYMNQAPPPPNITSSRHRYEQHSSESRRMRQSPPPPPPPASRPKDSTMNISRYGGAPSATDHHYRSRDDRSDRREESRKKDSSSGGSNRHAHAPYDSNKSSYGGMSRSSESNTWPSAPVKSSYGTISSSSGTNNMVMSSRPDPWSNSNNSREIETAVWQRPPQPPPDKWNSTSSNPSSMSISGRSSSSNTLYGNNHQVIPNMGLNMSTSYSDSRFDSYKMSGMSRKY
ncbi:scaffold attachment factor B2 isoform X2 [Acyrthosiphon pisum]|uniref:SAFB-like transcription modulator n=1 Tax=Acyrthosiphon pisum TaxID=7029 RepID=A0A8R2HBB2_ACYPI|nr:scaffold attachment factor B2 isoform X2 [Acyrthosiphon pisum]|eukprot:XP_016664093.1 PREDICTED: scaffold attachment factor B2 isoform X2 [Acyrthosiphon pisum]